MMGPYGPDAGPLAAFGPQLPAGPDPQAAPEHDAGEQPSPEELLDGMLKLALLFHTVSNDAGDRLKIEKATTLLTQIKADHQAQHDQLLGGNVRALRRIGG